MENHFELAFCLTYGSNLSVSSCLLSDFISTLSSIYMPSGMNLDAEHPDITTAMVTIQIACNHLFDICFIILHEITGAKVIKK